MKVRNLCAALFVAVLLISAQCLAEETEDFVVSSENCDSSFSTTRRNFSYALQNVTPEERRERIRQYVINIASGMELTEEQRITIKQILAMVPDEAFQVPGYFLNSPEYKKIIVLIQSTFTKDQAAQLFDTSFDNGSSGQTLALEESCSCNTSDDWCGDKWESRGSNRGARCVERDCERSDWGCGALFLFSCNGVCEMP